MKTISKMFRAGLGLVLMGAFLTAMAAAQCASPTAKLHKQAWRVGDPTALLIQAADTVEPIVGMWHVTFTAEGNSGGPPDGTPIDNSLVVWHSDHTEIMASSRPAQDGDFCLGVWERTGKSKYKLNHLAWLAARGASLDSREKVWCDPQRGFVECGHGDGPKREATTPRTALDCAHGVTPDGRASFL